MAEKKSMSTRAAKAVAMVKSQPQFQGKWGVSEHLACLRHMSVDSVREMSKDARLGKPMDDKKPDGPKWGIAELVNEDLRATFRADPELGYASNFEKLLVKCGDLQKADDYA
jgi:hypothetical protein